MSLFFYVKIFGTTFQNNGETNQSQTEQIILDIILWISTLEVQIFQKISTQKLIFVSLSGEIVAGEN